MEKGQPRWRRRSADRPGEIAEAALAEFAARGYAAARVADIAAAAGVSKAALFTYFPTKADLLRAVVAVRFAPMVAAAAGAVAGGSFADQLTAFLGRLGEAMADPAMRRLAKTIIAESGNFPEIGTAWHDQVVGPALAALTAAIAVAQTRGEVRAGDPRLMAFGVVGPMLMGALWREVIEPAGGAPLDLEALAAEHLQTVLGGFAPS